jgi:hypothetical protein
MGPSAVCGRLETTKEEPVPESKRRKKETRYSPEQTKGERKVARIGSPSWLAPAMVACFVIGLTYIVVFYIAGSSIPIMNTIGGSLNALVNVGIGFGFIIVGFILSTKWK